MRRGWLRDGVRLGSVVPDFVQDQDAYVDALLKSCAEHVPRSLILAHDGSIEAVRRRRAEVERVVGLALAPEQALAVAIDKTHTLAFAKPWGYAHPGARSSPILARPGRRSTRWGLPVVVKPTRSWAQEAGAGRRLISTV